MPLDHLRDLIHIDAVTGNPLNLQTTTAQLFLTRWITHFCAPLFVFLAGSSAFLYSKTHTASATRALLLTRGIWLIVLEFTIITFGIWWDIHFQVFIQQVIAAIGFAMIVLSLLLSIKPLYIGVTGITIISLHGLLAVIKIPDAGAVKILGTLFFGMGLLPLHSTTVLLVAYPFIPWMGVFFVGYYAGTLFALPSANQKKYFKRIAFALLGLFFVLRVFNVYGDPNQWTVQKNSLYSFLSFINVSKYPPSLLFCLLTLGVMFLLLNIIHNKENRFLQVISIYGRVPFFYYLVHWYAAHVVMFLILFSQGFSVADFEFGFGFGRPKAANGLPLWGVYLVWIALVSSLYPLCKWYGKYKLNHPEKNWLKYM